METLLQLFLLRAKRGLCLTSQALGHPSRGSLQAGSWPSWQDNFPGMLSRERMLHYLSPVLSQQGQHSLGQIFCHTPGHKTHFLASDLENNTLRGMTFLAALPELNVLSMSLATPTCSPEEARSG